MAKENVSTVPVWGIPRLDPGYIYILQDRGRLKIGKSKDRSSRIRAAKTWLPDGEVLGIKPFWNVRSLERELHIGLAQWWYEGEWFDPADDPYLEDFLHNFRAFKDTDQYRDMNSVNFIYWMHDMAEIGNEYGSRNDSLRAFQRDLSEVKKLPG